MRPCSRPLLERCERSETAAREVTMSQHAAIAVNRFGLGARPGEMEVAASNPQRWLLEQLEGPYVEPKQFKGFATTAQHRENYSYRYTTLGRGLNEAQRK